MKTLLAEGGYLKNFIYNPLSVVKLEGSNGSSFKWEKQTIESWAFLTQYHLTVPNLKEILMIEQVAFNITIITAQQSSLREILKEPPVILYRCRKECSPEDMLVRAKL